MLQGNQSYKKCYIVNNDLQVISHKKFGRNVFVGCIVTNAAFGSDVMENLLFDFKKECSA